MANTVPTDSGKKGSIPFWKYVSIAVFVIFILFLYTGFYFPDEAVLRRGGVSTLVLLIRIFFLPAIALSIYVLFLFVKNRINRMNVGLVLFGIIVGGVAALHLGIFGYEIKKKKNSEISQFHPFLQLKPRPDDSGALQAISKFTIACLGGSTTEFRDSKGNDWPSMAEKKLHGLSKCGNFKLVNYGRQWYSTQHILINYMANVRPFSPDVIMVMEAINDLLCNADRSYFSGGAFRRDYGHFYGASTKLVKGGGFIKEFFGNILMKLWYQTPRRQLELKEFPGIASYEYNLRAIISLAKMDGTKVILMTQPTLLKENLSPTEQRVMHMVNVETSGPDTRWSYSTAYRGMSQYNNAMRKIAAEENVPLIDLEKRVPKDLNHFWDEVHYSDTTFPVIAALVADKLQALYCSAD